MTLYQFRGNRVSVKVSTSHLKRSAGLSSRRGAAKCESKLDINAESLHVEGEWTIMNYSAMYMYE